MTLLYNRSDQRWGRDEALLQSSHTDAGLRKREEPGQSFTFSLEALDLCLGASSLCNGGLHSSNNFVIVSHLPLHNPSIREKREISNWSLFFSSSKSHYPRLPISYPDQHHLSRLRKPGYEDQSTLLSLRTCSHLSCKRGLVAYKVDVRSSRENEWILIDEWVTPCYHSRISSANPSLVLPDCFIYDEAKERERKGRRTECIRTSRSTM